MKVLVVGGGGREHAIAWKLMQSERITKLYAAPGNAGIAQVAQCVPIDAMDTERLVKFATAEGIDFTVIGPDDPLAAGCADAFIKAGMKVFGPVRDAARLEYSKAWSKAFMKKYAIPTARYEVFDTYDAAAGYAQTSAYPFFIKADGLALGKGAVRCDSFDEACATLDDIMVKKVFGASGDTVVIEDLLAGPEVTVLAFCDGKTIVPFISAQDHKRALDGDKGLNTGGMGVIAPSPHYDKDMAALCMDRIFKPTLAGLITEGIIFKGIIYFGLMLTQKGPMVIEYNARFGDPEAQAVLPLLKNDLLDIFLACENGSLDSVNIEWKDEAAACVMLASGGYPSSYVKGYEISGLNSAADREDLYVFHSGTAIKDGRVITNGGRVLGVTAWAKTLPQALDSAYAGVKEIRFNNMHYRTDIGRA